MINSAEVRQGAVKIKEDSIGKYVDVAGTSRYAFPNKHAYGTWEFDLYRTTQQMVTFIADSPDSTYNTADGYTLRYITSGGIVLIGGITHTGLFSLNSATWYSFRITRTLAGLFSIYVRSDEDSNYPTWTSILTPVIDTAFTSSNFSAFRMNGAGDRIRNFTHKVGVEQ